MRTLPHCRPVSSRDCHPWAVAVLECTSTVQTPKATPEYPAIQGCLSRLGCTHTRVGSHRWYSCFIQPFGSHSWGTEAYRVDRHCNVLRLKGVIFRRGCRDPHPNQAVPGGVSTGFTPPTEGLSRARWGICSGACRKSTISDCLK